MNILLVGFKENENSSKLLLDLITPKYYIDKLYLCETCDVNKEKLLEHMRHKTYDYVFLFAMKDKDKIDDAVSITTYAKDHAQGYETNYKYDTFFRYLQEHNINTVISNTLSDSLANELYLTSLKQIHKYNRQTKCILIQIPPVAEIDIMKFAFTMIRYFHEMVKA